jgi:hypothetical protein
MFAVNRQAEKQGCLLKAQIDGLRFTTNRFDPRCPKQGARICVPPDPRDFKSWFW